MALGRDSIEKKDFPVGRRGYDPAAVDAHLSTIADQVEELTQASSTRAEPVAAAISEQVRGIVEAAEHGAAEIQARAQQEARELRAEAVRIATRQREQATQEAATEREKAAGQAREYVGRVSESTSKMLERLGTIDGELNSLTDSLRAAAERLRAELERLQSELGGLSSATSHRPQREAEPGDAAVADGGDALDQSTAGVEQPVTTPVQGGDRAEATTTPISISAFARQGPETAAESGKVGDRPPEDPVPESAPAAPASVLRAVAAPEAPASEEQFEQGADVPAGTGRAQPERVGSEAATSTSEAPIAEAEATGAPAEADSPSEAASSNSEAVSSTSESVGSAPAETTSTQTTTTSTQTPAEPPDKAANSLHQVVKSEDTEGARLIALNMALNGTPRDETDRYLAQNFSLQDRKSLLDEVYASVQG